MVKLKFRRTYRVNLPHRIQLSLSWIGNQALTCIELLSFLTSSHFKDRHDVDIASGVAMAFPGGRLAHPEGQNEEENT